jgi:lipopolysaccharide/colanic/teichoic acid biosynthesis glycosyltransferase
VVASKDRHEHFPEMTLMKAKLKGIRVESGASFLERLSGHVPPRDLRMSYLIFGEGLSRGWSYKTLQRAIDLVGASFLLVLALPVLVLTALAIKLESPGPVLYRQRRLGINDKPFMMNKLRSMRKDAESESGAVFTSDVDDRITRVGHFTRRTRLDELPQLWNVLRGEMSLVGPRAERPEFAELLLDQYPLYGLRTSVRPGVTGWAQTRFGYVNSFEAYEEKLALDLYYLKHRSIPLDLMILLQTVKTVLFFKGL